MSSSDLKAPPPTPALRHAFRDYLAARMAIDDRVVCVDTDTGLFNGVDFGRAAHRYLDVGIAEHCQMGVAAGLAADGWRPFAVTMAAFAASRASEFVKIDLAYAEVPVCIAGTHGGLAAGHLGPTHHALEDLAVMRQMPNMTVLAPGDPAGMASLLDQCRDLPGPVYVRLDRKPTGALPGGAGEPVLGRLQVLREADVADAVLVATGPLPVRLSLEAADLLAAQSLQVSVLQAHTIKPFDEEGLVRHCAGAAVVAAVEEHWRVGGLGSAVSEVLGEAGTTPVLRLGLPDRFVSEPGSQEYLLAAAGITAEGIASAVLRGVEHRADRMSVPGGHHNGGRADLYRGTTNRRNHDRLPGM